jgi:hypothetical protein
MFEKIKNWFMNLFGYGSTFTELKPVIDPVEISKIRDEVMSKPIPSSSYTVNMKEHVCQCGFPIDECYTKYIKGNCKLARYTPPPSYVTRKQETKKDEDDGVDLLVTSLILNAALAPKSEPVFEGKGGEFGGAGASGSWEYAKDDVPVVTETPKVVETIVAVESVSTPEPETSRECKASDYSDSSSSSSYSSSSDSSSYSSSSDSGSSSSSSSDSGSW